MVGNLFSCWGPASFQERDAVSFSEVSPSKISFTRGRESRRVARSNQSMMMQNVCGKDSPAPTLRKRLIFGAPVCRIPKIDPTWLAHIVSKVLVVERPPTIEKTSWDSENWVVLKTTQQNCPNSLAFFLLECHRPTSDLTTCPLPPVETRESDCVEIAECILGFDDPEVLKALSFHWGRVEQRCKRGVVWCAVGCVLPFFLRAGKPWKFGFFGSCFFSWISESPMCFEGSFSGTARSKVMHATFEGSWNHQGLWS